ncbi:G5 domain-containing protein, partial [Streptococcus infantis]
MANNERKDHFSIRKFSVGAASVLVGASIFGLSAQTVQAEENKTIMGSDVLESENKVKVMLDFFDNPTPAINQVNEQIAEIKSEKEVVRNPNDYSQDSFQKYTEAVKVAEVSIPAAEKAVEKAEEIQGKAEGFRKEMAETLPPEVRKDINYNIVTQEQKRAMYDRFNEMYTEVNYRTTYIDATAALSKSNKSLKDAVKGLVQSTAKDLAVDGTFDDKVPEASKIKVKSFASLTSDDQAKISSLIEDHFNLAPLSPSISYDQTNAIITYNDKSITRLPLTEVAIAESNDTPAPTPKPEVKKALLEAAITKALETLKPADTSNKTEDSVAAYQKALTALTTETAKAEAVKVDTSADQPKVDQAVTDLTAAIKTVEAAKTALVDKTAPTPSVDKAKLEEALTKAVEALKPADTSNKTEDSVSAYQKALANLTSEKAKAETVKNDAKADQPKVNQAEKDLTAAITVVEAAKSALVEKQAEKPKPKVVEKEETKVEVLAYKTIRRDNADLEKGKENVVQKGKDGSVTTVEHVVIVDGVEKERKVVSTNKVDAVDEIIEVGTKEPAAPVEPSKPEPKVVEKEETKVEVVPYKTVRRDNADLEKGKENVVQEGKAGSITTVVKIVIVDGVEKERKVVSTDKVDAVDKIIEVGTKEPAAPVEPSKPEPKVVEKEETKVEVVPYKTVRRDNADLEKGKEKVVQEGKAGSITTVVKIVIVDGVEKERKVVSTDKVDAVDKIIEVGTKAPAAPVEPSKPTPKVVEKEETKVEVVPYKTIRRDNADLEKGKENVVQEGKAGSITTVVKIVIVDGVEKERKVVSTDKVDAVDKIIEVGTKEPAAPVEPSKPEPKVVEKEETKVEVVPYKTVRRDNANLAKGTEKVVQEGKEGIITTIEHVVLVDGVEKERKVIVSNKVDAVDKIIEVGTQESGKPGETPVEPSKPETKIVEKDETKVEILSYKTIRQDNANLAKGVEKVIQEGKDGSITTVEHVVLADGKEVERKLVSMTKVDAIDKIIEVGTKVTSTPGDTPVEPAKPEAKIVEKEETKVE